MLNFVRRWLQGREIQRTRRSLREYYRKCELWLPRRPGFRQFRFVYRSNAGRNKFIKIPDRVNTEKALRKWLIEFAPFDAYYTTSMWLDPQKMGPRELKRAGYPFAYNVFLGQELYFDIDMPGDLDGAKQETLDLVSFLETRYGYGDFELVYSGNKGFHVYVYDFELGESIADPRKRENRTQEKKAVITNEIIKKGIAIDVDITLDTRRIIRLPNTINSKSMNRCEIVDINHIGTFTPQRLEALLRE